MGSGSDKLGVYELQNTLTGERATIIWESGGNTERLLLQSPTTGKLRDILTTNEGNATAVRANKCYAGAMLLPFANRIRNGTYTFFNKTYHLPRNEIVPGVRKDAIHGLIFNKTLETRSWGCSNETGVPTISVTLGHTFGGGADRASFTAGPWVRGQEANSADTAPGWPFKVDVNITYSLSPGRFAIRTRAKSLEESEAVPWSNSWHPYFAVGSIAQARVEFDRCVPEPASDVDAGATLWNHVTMGAGAPRDGDLIPTGAVTPWTSFDGIQPIGGSEAEPTFMDDEFESALPRSSAESSSSCGDFKQRIHDDGGDNATLVLFADRQHRVYQIYTGAREKSGVNGLVLEPMSALADAYNNGDGLTVLWPGDTFDGTFGASIE